MNLSHAIVIDKQQIYMAVYSPFTWDTEIMHIIRGTIKVRETGQNLVFNQNFRYLALWKSTKTEIELV